MILSSKAALRILEAEASYAWRAVVKIGSPGRAGRDGAVALSVFRIRTFPEEAGRRRSAIGTPVPCKASDGFPGPVERGMLRSAGTDRSGLPEPRIEGMVGGTGIEPVTFPV